MRAETSRQWSNVLLDPACERARLLISRHIDRELSADDTIALRAHLGACARCRKALEIQTAQSEELAEALKALWPGDSDSETKNKVCAQHRRQIRRRRMTLRALSCLFVLTALFVFAQNARAPKDAASDKDISNPSSPLEHDQGELKGDKSKNNLTLAK